MSEELQLTCPVCRARFRGETSCSRCGADISPLMELATRAFVLRNRACSALNRNDLALASTLIRKANTLHRTSAGETLENLISTRMTPE